MAETTLGIKQIANKLGCSEKTVRRKFEKGELPGAIQTGKGAAIKISESALRELSAKRSASVTILREIVIPCIAMRRDQAAASIGISTSTFDSWVEEGVMPRGVKKGGVVLWDTAAIKAAWYRLYEAVGDPSTDEEPVWQADGEDAA